MLDQFYQTKGDFTQWNEQDATAFKNAMANLSALLAIPDYATQSEWNQARDAYKQVQREISLQLGFPYKRDKDTGAILSNGIWELVYDYYNMSSETPEKETIKDKFLSDHPYIQQAMDLQAVAVTSNPLLFKYYGGLETLRRYYTTQMYNALNQKYPPTDPRYKTVVEEWTWYYALKDEGIVLQRDMETANPGLSDYIAAKQNKYDALREALGTDYPSQEMWDTYDYYEWAYRVTRNRSFSKTAKAYYDAFLAPYGAASKQYDLEVEAAFAQRYGADYALSLEATYQKWNSIINEKAYAYRDAHPEMDKYSEEKSKLQGDIVLQAFDRFVQLLPEQPQVNIRPDFVPKGTTAQALAQMVVPQQQKTFQQYAQEYALDASLQRLILDYYYKNLTLPSSVLDDLDYKTGGNGTQLLQDMLLALYRAGQKSQLR